ncbi:MAG: hypothetical protein GQ477_04460 [Nanohaloarchaea archaeon]|nr:hypothetical protein [Candidatus Nanohaloarchaea archaeon]
MLIDMNLYLIGVIIVMLLGIVLGMRRILSLEEKITYILGLIKDEEDSIDKKVYVSNKYKLRQNKIQKKKKLLSKIKKNS